MSNDSIGLVRPRHAIGPVILHVLPPASQTVQANDQGGHGCHAGHQVHRPVLTASCRRVLLVARSIASETLAAQVLWGSGQHGLSPVLVRQGVLVAHGATWWAARRQVLILKVRGVRLGHARLLLCKADGLGSQRVIGELLLGGLSRGMLSDLFFHSSHCSPSSACASVGGSVLCSLPCCSHCCCLCCLASLYSLSTCWCKRRRRL